MVGSEIGVRGKSWILEGLEFCSKELICRRERSPEISQLQENQDPVVIQKDLRLCGGWVVIHSKPREGKIWISCLPSKNI